MLSHTPFIMTKNTADPVGTLTIGNVVSASITLYKSNFKRYFQVSLRATAWGVAMVVSMIPFLILGGFLIRVTNPGVAMIPLVLVWFVFALYCLAKYATDRATISRLAYQELIDQPETITVATQALAPRTWAFLRLSCLIGIYMFLVFIVGYILLIIAFGLGGAMLAMLSLTSNPLAIIISAILGIIVFILWILAMIRYYSYWFIAELPLAVESTNSASVCLRRSKTLSLMAVSRLQLIIFIAFLTVFI